MATQISAITLIGTTGLGATDGMKFVQYYFGLPIAMVILGVTLVPLLHRAKYIRPTSTSSAGLIQDALTDRVSLPALARNVVWHYHRSPFRRVRSGVWVATAMVRGIDRNSDRFVYDGRRGTGRGLG
jgi:hypothetical protein